VRIGRWGGKEDTMSEGVAVRETRGARHGSCRHHWVIQSPNGVTSRGVCKNCGRQRDFPNAAADAMWEREGLGRWARQGASRPVDISIASKDDKGK
jgi:hypothetical protein